MGHLNLEANTSRITSPIITSGGSDGRAPSYRPHTFVDFRLDGNELGFSGQEMAIDCCGQIKFYVDGMETYNDWTGNNYIFNANTPGTEDESTIMFYYADTGWLMLQIKADGNIGCMFFDGTNYPGAWIWTGWPEAGLKPGVQYDLRWKLASDGITVWLKGDIWDHKEHTPGVHTGMSGTVYAGWMGRKSDQGQNNDDGFYTTVIHSWRMNGSALSDAEIEAWP